jgi:hypothetical protein
VIPARGARAGARRRSGRPGSTLRMHEARTMLWLGRRLWRPVTAELLRERGRRRARRRAVARLRVAHRPAPRRTRRR